VVRRYDGHEDAPALVWRAPTRVMNPTVPQSLIDAELEEDPVKGSSEYLAEGRTDIESFVRREVVDAAIVPNRQELPPALFHYTAFADLAAPPPTL
jgi:hypothetical protein